MNGSPPLPWHQGEMRRGDPARPVSRIASASGFSRAGNAAMAAAPLPRAAIGALGMDEVVLQVAQQ